MTTRPIPETLAIPGEKIGGYLLKLDHPSGGSKAKFFLGVGFSAADPVGFADAVFAHVDNPDTEMTFIASGGLTKMVCQGPLRTPTGRWTRIRSVWVVTGPDEAQLVTAVPSRHRPRTPETR
ncbi:DUF6883 domain-containing protein [Methylobacterium pseudosasicola]|uniref:DUF6883 domain-containing protein n=1 Tax=Methylobacterium pseudosasicola TaxID=582667 RepID=A0A1I4H778_9HYPH|nr:DUF6883 domain-containing protein [Methylobacterium pseudosasicola]SFL37503.1 hypothetical protein SAMN05192568_100446 [Methylobacterium pseudosasicola]